MQFKLDNKALVRVRSGKTGEIIYEEVVHNDISNDFLCGRGRIFVNNEQNTGTEPWCFLLPDGAAWSGFTFDPTNPAAPYCVQANNYNHLGAQVDNLGQSSYQNRSGGGGVGSGLQPPYGQSGGLDNSANNKWKFFFAWNALPVDLSLKAIGLTGWQTNIGDTAPQVFGAFASPTIFVPDTLVVLPTAIVVKGNTPGPADILEVSYFLSIVGA